MFVKPEGMVGIQNTFTHFVEPIHPPNQHDQDFYFDLPFLGSMYMSVRDIQLYVRGCLKHRDGTVLDDKDNVKFANNGLCYLFDSCMLYVGNNQQEVYVPNIPYKVFIK